MKPETEAAIRAEYAKDHPNLTALAERLGRDKANVCRDARLLGLTDQRRLKKPIEERYRGPNTHTAPAKYTAQERSLRLSEATKARWAKNGHPRGMAGKKHSEETRKLLTEAIAARWADPGSAHNSAEFRQRLSDRMVRRVESGEMRSGYSRCRGGLRADLGIVLRSAWESNYARWLNAQVACGAILAWRYEPRVFVFQSARRGTRCYTPDFEVTMLDGSIEWHEVKGWMDEPSRRRLAKMAECYPSEMVVLRDARWFAENRATLRELPGYER